MAIDLVKKGIFCTFLLTPSVREYAGFDRSTACSLSTHKRVTTDFVVSVKRPWLVANVYFPFCPNDEKVPSSQKKRDFGLNHHMHDAV